MYDRKKEQYDGNGEKIFSRLSAVRIRWGGLFTLRPIIPRSLRVAEGARYTVVSFVGEGFTEVYELLRRFFIKLDRNLAELIVFLQKNKN